ncbi:PLxRFG domain-containing protein [Bilophila wadsworthia]|uniref:PLxRFG domain-containing protein n=2 Tax=Bilophila wadsworthia TaxID=35833 RepID=UPI001D125BE8|nr:PLxRFG domain-containing protein [Bilophila wadsworthia]MCC2714203.1 PLxRFG domain-containing protein [Bilophila wadsworthia]
MFDSNILSFYQDGEFRKLPENEKQSIIENYFDKSIAPSLSASEEDKAVARTNFMKTHELSGGFDSRVLDWYKDPEFASLPSEEKATVLGNFYDKMSGKAAQYLDPEVREQQRELFVAQNMLLPEDKGGWIDAAVDGAKNLGHGIETTLRQAGRQIAVHSDDLPDIESISDLEDIRQNPEEYAERFNRERTKGTISADPNDSTNKAVREKQMRDEVYRAKYGHLENPVGDWLPLDPSGAQASAPYSATGALVGGLSLMGSATAMPVAGIGNVILGASSKDQFLVDKLNQVNEFSRKFRGRPLDQEETDAVVAEYNLMGNQYGGIEALTELGSDFVFNRIVGRIFGKNAVKGALNKLGGFGLDAAGEHTGETIAQYTQGNIEHEAGLSDKRYSGGEGILQAFKEQAGTTNLMLGMTHGPVAAAEYTRSKFFSADKPVLDSSPSPVPRTEEEKGGKLDLLGLNPGVSPKALPYAAQDAQYRAHTDGTVTPASADVIDADYTVNTQPNFGIGTLPPAQGKLPTGSGSVVMPNESTGPTIPMPGIGGNLTGEASSGMPMAQPAATELPALPAQTEPAGLGLWPGGKGNLAYQWESPLPPQQPPVASPIPEAPAVPQGHLANVSNMVDVPTPAPAATDDHIVDASTMMPMPNEVNTAAEQTPSSEERRYGSAEAPDTVALGGYFKEQLESGRQYGDIREARKEADALLGGVPAERKSTIVKDVDESVELGVTAAARDIVNDGKDAVDTFRGLVDLYHRQPNLSSRTSTSVANQQYSTPAPLAYLASQLAGIDKTKTVYEPTAGNGMLLIGADAKKSTVNELDANRASRLRAQDFDVTEHDATDYTPGKQYDAVIANPPFGTVKDDAGNKRGWEVSGHETAEIDQAIALKALQSMKPDGKAVLILGGKKGSEAGRRAKYNTATQRSFYKALYDNYKVADHFSVDGRLWTRQGASFPVDIIVVDGKGKTEGRPFPAANLPRVYKTFDSLEELLNGGKQEVRQGVDTERGLLGSGDSDAGRRDGDQGSATPVLASGGLAGRAASSEQRSGGGRAQSGERTSEAGHVQPGTELAETGGGRPAGPSDIGGSGQRVPRASVGQDGSERQEVAVADGKERGSAQVPDDGSKPADMARGAGSAVRARVVEEAPASAEDRKKPPVKQDVHKEDAAPKQEAAPSSTPKPKKQPTVTKGTDLQDVYQPASQSASLGTLIPKNMAAPIRDALENLREKHGDIDAFVAKELGYKDAAELAGRFAGEQVDAIALAIDNMSRGAGFITGDQTGIGKGRVNAAIIRWAKRNGKTPVFVTMKPELYADMIRDLNDIGETGFNPLPTNKLRGKNAIALPDGGKLESPSNLDKVIAKAISQGKLEGFDGIFTTYSQLAPSNGKDSPRRELLRSLNENTVLILDESHNAGGSDKGKYKKKDAAKSTGSFLRERIAESPNGVFYSSATYAKRPDVMSLYAKTDMQHAVEDLDQLTEIMSRGGIPMQQAVATMLTQAGQYIRREKSFEGATVDTAPAPVDMKVAERTAGIMGRIMAFDTAREGDIKNIEKQLAGSGEAVLADGSIGKQGMHSTGFSSIMHNLIGQYTLSMKADAAVEAAAKAVERGEKPVITVANTMGSFIGERASADGLKDGDAVDLSWKDMFLRYLDKTRTITVDKPGSKEKDSIYLSDDQLSPEALRAYNEAKDAIEKADFSNLPVSPIDRVLNGLRERGIRADEITGRTDAIDYSDGQQKYRKREATSSNNVDVVNRFNGGELDALIINQSGSTGISLHASENFADQKKRNMIIVQPELNIDVFMQTLGRVFRTGQVTPPAYQFLISDMPSEKRPAAVLGKKMASLNANTTANRKSAQTFENIPDFLNEYGDMAAVQVLRDNPEFNKKLGNPIKEASDIENAMQKVTGRIPVLSVKEQEQLYALLEQEYADTIAMAEAMGGTGLEAQALPLDAKLVSSIELTPKKDGVDAESAFTEASNLQEFDVKVLGKPYTAKKVHELVAQGVVGHEGLSDALHADAESFVEKRAAKMEDEERRGDFIARAEENLHAIDDALFRFEPGTQVSLLGRDGPMDGVVTRISRKKGDNPTALSNWQMTVAVTNAQRQITIPFSKLARNISELESGKVVVAPSGLTEKQMETAFDSAQNEVREKRWIATGNLLAAAEKLKTGKIITFDDTQGSRRMGILLNKGVDAKELVSELDVKFPAADDALRFFERTGGNGMVKTSDKLLRISRMSPYGDTYRIAVPAAKATGGKYYLNTGLLSAIGQDFVKAGRDMVARHIDEAQLRAAMNALQKQGYSLVADNFRTEARDVTGTAIEVQKVDLTRASLKDGGKDVVGYVSPEIASTLRLNKPGEIILNEKGIQHIEEGHGEQIRAAGFKNAEAFVNHALKNIEAVYQAGSNRKYDLVAKQGTPWQRVIVRLEFDSAKDYYTVVTAGPIRDTYYQNKTPLWERAPSFHSENSEPMGTPRAFTGQSSVSQDANASDRENIDSSRASVNDSFMDLAGKRPPHRARVRSQAVERIVSALNNAAKNATQTEVVQRFEDLPEHIRQQYKGRESVFEGGYDTGTGKIWFVAANINSLDRVSEIWMHEQIGHHGMHSLLTPQERKQLTNQLWAQLGGMGNEGIRDIAERYDLDPRLNAADRETVIEEYVSKRAEKKNAGELSKADAPLWKRIVSAVRRMLARAMRRITGRELNLGDERVDALLSRLGQHVFNGTGKPADVNTATDKPTVRASLAEEHVREELRSGKGLLSAIKQMRKLRLANDEDISLLQKTARPTQFLAKDHPEVQQLLDIQLDREETRSQKVEEAMKGVYDGLKNLSKAQHRNLTALLHKLDGKKLNAITEERFVKRTLPDGDWEYSGLNDAHYEQLRDFLTQHNTFKGVNGENVSLDGKTVDVFITIRRMLDNSQLGLYNHLRESKLPKNVIDTYRSSMGSVHNYFPHVRFGDHSIRVLDGEGNVLERRHFFGTKLTADAKATKILEELKAKYGDSIKDVEYGKLQDLSEDVFEFPMRTADMEKVLQEALNSTGIDGDIKKKLLRAMEQQVSDLFKARGFGQHMMRRNNIAGYEMEDIGKVLFTYCSGQYGWLTKMDAAMKFGETLAKVDAKKKPRLYAWAKNYVMDMLRNADRLDALVDTAKNLMFLNFLGGNFKTAAVNLTQNLITGYPRLGVELGFKHAATSFIRDAGKALCHQISDGKAKSITPEEKAFLQDFYDRGITRDNFMREMMGDLTGGRMSYAWRQFSRVMAWPMSAAERFNRTSLALAAYRAARAGKVVNTETLERFGYQKGQKFDEQSARDFAAGLVTDSHYLYGKANRPEIFRHGDVGKVASSFYTFRSFTHNTLEFWRTLFKMGWRGKAAVGISLGMTATLGGLVSVPLWSTAMTVWRQLFADGDDPERKLYNWAYKNGGKNAADVLFYGVPSMAGVTISGSLGMELPILQDLKGDKPWGRQILSSGMEIFGVPVAMLEKIGNTFEFAGKGDYWRATEEALPTAASNVMKAIRLADEGMTTRSGKPIADGTGRPIKLSKSESVAKALGFQPVRQSKAFDAHKGQSDVEAFKKNKQDELVTRYLKAFRAKDMAAKEEVLRDWRDYNNKMIREDKRHLVIKPLYPLAMQRMKPNKPQASMRGYARETMQLQ